MAASCNTCCANSGRPERQSEAGFRGADTAALDTLSTELGDSSAQVQALSVKLKKQFSSVEWYGVDADQFRTTILSLTSAMSAAAQAMCTASSDVQKQSAQQNATSSASGGAPTCGAPTSNPVAAPAMPSSAAPPAAVTAWWNSLTAEQQQAAVQVNPAKIGSMDGVPVVARDRANRIILAQQMAGLQQQKYGLAQQYKFSNIDQRVRLVGKMQSVEDKIAGLTAIQTKLDSPGGNAFLLGVDTAGTGRVVMALGNPDTADHVGIFVPGMTSNITGAEGLINQAQVIKTASDQQDPTGSNSSILWLGYDAPPGVVTAAFESRAEKAGPALDLFIDGINATHGGDADVTVIGHSYGSVVTGVADRDFKLNADKMFFIGSPGVGVDSAAELSVGAQNVYASTASNDIIRRTPSPGEMGRIGLSVLFPQLAPVLLPEALNPQNEAMRFGPSPSSTQFGGNVVPTVPGAGSERNAHSSYFATDNPAMIGIGQVITNAKR